MPSPFPGMDPYLEDPALWPDVHHELITACRELLNKQLRPRYVARVETRVYVEGPDDPARRLYVSDIHINARAGAGKSGKREAGGVQVLESVPIVYMPELELTESRIELTATDTREIVAVIELLSPANKARGSAGRASFLGKKHEILDSPAHWVEIDLLRAGVPDVYRDGLPPHEYAVAVYPAGERPTGRAWPIRLTDSLPTLDVPLRGSDPPAPLDLQQALALAYDRAGYDMSVDYSAAPPAPPLPPKLAAWARKLLKAKGVR